MYPIIRRQVDEGGLTTDDMVTISECAGVLHVCTDCFEGMKHILQKTDISLLSVLT